jgi:hypothetical protein
MGEGKLERTYTSRCISSFTSTSLSTKLTEQSSREELRINDLREHTVLMRTHEEE